MPIHDKQDAIKEAENKGFKASNVVKATGTQDYFIAPHSLENTPKFERMYAGLREKGYPAKNAARITFASRDKEINNE